MKMLVAIPSSHPRTLRSINWASRGGFDMRVFIPSDKKKKKWRTVLDHAKYDHYLDLRANMIINDKDPLAYAQAEGYELLAIVPANLKTWNNNEDKDEMIIQFHGDLGEARKRISNDTTLHDIVFENGTRVIRVVNL